MKSRLVKCVCGAAVLVQFPKRDAAPSIGACDHCAPINHDGTPRKQ